MPDGAAANGTMNGGEPRAPAANEVQRLGARALELLVDWIRRGESEPQHPVTRWPTAAEARKGISLPPLPERGAAGPDASADDALVSTIKHVLTDSVNPWTGRFLDKLYAAPDPVGVVADMTLSVLNANGHVMTASPALTMIEEACVRSIAERCGWTDPNGGEDGVDGLTMPGGSAANTLALQAALQAHFPGYREEGVLAATRHILELRKREKQPTPAGSLPRPVVLTSAQGHYSIEKACIACGLGKEAAIEVPCDEYGAMDPQALRRVYHNLRADPERYPFFINATAGTTVMGAFDDLTALSAFAQENGLYLHVDGSWGGPVLFSNKHRSRMEGIHLADSITINPHKLLNVPIQCSFLIFRQGKKVLAGGGGDGAAYLFHSTNMGDNPGMKTLGCGRRSDAIKFYLYGIKHGWKGMGEHVDRGIALAGRVIDLIDSRKDTLQRHRGPKEPFLQVCFRPYSSAVEALPTAERNEKLSHAARTARDQLQAEKMFLVDFAPLPDGAGDFIRLVVHPNTNFVHLQELVNRIDSLGQRWFREGH